MENPVHILTTDFNPVSTRSKRWKSSIHTIPAGTDLMDLRKSRWGGCRVHFDYSQHEIRALAYVSQDSNLQAAFQSGEDIHQTIAASVWKKPFDDVTEAERKFSKGASFSIIYGSGIKSFADLYTDGDMKEAKSIMDTFFENFPAVKTFIHEKHMEAIMTGQVTTVWGNPLKVDFPEKVLEFSNRHKEAILEGKFIGCNSMDRSKVKAAFRRAQNAPIQAMASSIAAESIYEISRRMKDDKCVIDCFTHDAGDVDIDMSAIFKLFRIIPEHTVEMPKSRYGFTAKCDTEIGISGNSLLKMKDTRVTDDSLEFHFEGKMNAFLKLEKAVERNGLKFDYSDLSIEEKRVPVGEMFKTKGAFSSEYGTVVKRASGNISIHR